MNIQDINKIIQLHFRLILGCLAVMLCYAAVQDQKQADVRDYMDFGFR